MKAKEIPNGGILWFKDFVVGVKGATLQSIYDEAEVKINEGNPIDYDLLEQDFSEEQIEDLERAKEEWFQEEEEEDSEEQNNA